MRTLVLTISVLGLALLLTSVVRTPVTDADPKLGQAISTFDLTVAAGPLQTSNHPDAN
jgi:hypothetical protein